jgi:hypothetical protein
MEKVRVFFREFNYFLWEHMKELLIIVILVLLVIGFLLGPATDPQPDWLYFD